MREQGIIGGAGTMWELVERRGEATPDRRMLVDGAGRTVTFGEFRDRAAEVAAGLFERGIGEGSVVSWQLPTGIDTMILSMALSRLGAVQNPIIHLYREREVSFILGQTEPQLYVIPGVWRDVDYGALAERALDRAGFGGPKTHRTGPEVLAVNGDLPRGNPSVLPAPPSPAKDSGGSGGSGDPGRPGGSVGGGVRWIYYTSGSTADPKGVRHTDASLIAGGMGLAGALDMSAEDVGTIAFPFAHIAGPDYLVTMLAVGFSAVVVGSFSAVEVLPLFRRHKVTMVGGSTAFYIAYLAEQRKDPAHRILPDLRLMSGGGAAKPAGIHYEVKEEIGGRGVVHGYGMTEVPMISNGSPQDGDEQLANTDGRPVEGAEVRIVGADGRVAGPDEEGEIRVRGPMVCVGYTDPGATESAFDKDGYFRTGDLGRLRPDGHLVITGRLKDIIVRKGENVSATEVEGVLYQHPKVAEVAVIGLPDPERGERVCAVVQLADPADRLDLVELAGFCREAGLMSQKIPEQLEIREDWPRAGTGKIVKKALREEYGGA